MNAIVLWVYDLIRIIMKDSSTLGCSSLQSASSLPFLIISGYEGRLYIFNVQTCSIIRELCVFSDMGMKKTVPSNSSS